MTTKVLGETMLEPKEALTKALDYFLETFPATGITDLSIESLGLSDDKAEWTVTVSYKRKAEKTETSSLELLFAEKQARELRTIRIKSDDGSFIAIESPNTKK